MRELTSDELLLVSGGTDTAGEEITCYGYTFDQFSAYQDYAMASAEYRSQSSGNGSVNFDWAGLEVAIDDCARIVKEMIKAQPDHNAVEYGALIYWGPDGHLTISNLVRGNNDNMDMGPEVWRVTNGHPDATYDIVGFVHNHPTEGSDYFGDLANRRPGDADWTFMTNLANNGANTGVLNAYIVDPWDDLREYKFADYGLTAPSESSPII